MLGLGTPYLAALKLANISYCHANFEPMLIRLFSVDIVNDYIETCFKLNK